MSHQLDPFESPNLIEREFVRESIYLSACEKDKLINELVSSLGHPEELLSLIRQLARGRISEEGLENLRTLREASYSDWEEKTQASVNMAKETSIEGRVQYWKGALEEGRVKLRALIEEPYRNWGARKQVVELNLAETETVALIDILAQNEILPAAIAWLLEGLKSTNLSLEGFLQSNETPGNENLTSLIQEALIRKKAVAKAREEEIQALEAALMGMYQPIDPEGPKGRFALRG